MGKLSAIHFSPWSQLAGAQRSLLTLVAAQAQHQPVGVLVFEENSLAKRARALGAEVIIIDRRNFGRDGNLRSRFDLSRMREFATAVGAQVLHCHSAFGLRWVWQIAAATGLKLVCHQRDNFKQDDWHRDLDRADRIIAISRWVLGTMPPELRQRTSVVHNAVQMQQRRPSSPANLRIGMAGRSVSEKGAQLFLDALLPLMHAFNFDVTIWGLWSSDDRLVSWRIIQRVLRLDRALRKRITLHHFREDIENFFETTDVVVVPTLSPEPFGRMALESMAWNCITIVAGHGGLVEIVEDEISGLVFQPGDAASLRSKLERILNDPQFGAGLRRNGNIRAREHFSLEAHYREVQQIYAALRDGDTGRFA